MVQTFLRDAQWWVGGHKKGSTEHPGARDSCAGQEVEVTALLAAANEEGHLGSATDAQQDDTIVLDASDTEVLNSSVDLNRLTNALSGSTTVRDAAVGGMPQLPYPRTGRGRDALAAGRAKVIALTCPAPDPAQSEIGLAMLHPA